ncbi:hypothetical protein ADIS_0207 [Lunatimonas lonarensis]|uniref:Uncharacterized protein n=1 Tax=Lunatimonas lonarensis TaxID=1232681 RepID=R7ZYW1_9BACT|nr:hypothetical protein ADIS_0207 [Lunatimonas lonarensis]
MLAYKVMSVAALFLWQAVFLSFVNAFLLNYFSMYCFATTNSFYFSIVSKFFHLARTKAFRKYQEWSANKSLSTFL